MKILDQHVAVTEVLFAFGLVGALGYSIHQHDNVTVGTLVGGILGYMKGRSDNPNSTAGGNPA